MNGYISETVLSKNVSAVLSIVFSTGKEFAPMGGIEQGNKFFLHGVGLFSKVDLCIAKEQEVSKVVWCT